jgi:hypothetical protein
MNTCFSIHPSRPNAGLNRVDLMCMTATMTVLGMLAVPRVGGLALRDHRLVCANNLQLLGVGLQTWAVDHGENVPWWNTPRNDGSNAKIFAYEHWQVISNYVVSPSLLACPSTRRPAAKSFAALRDANVSYVIGSDSDLTMPSTLVSADLDMEGGSSGFCGIINAEVQAFEGTFLQPDSYRVAWSKTNHIGRGNVITADGGVKQVDAAGLAETMSRSTYPGNRSHSLIPR